MAIKPSHPIGILLADDTNFPHGTTWEGGEFQAWVSEHEEAALLYYLVVEVNGGVISTIDTLKRGPDRGVARYVNEWVMLSQSKVLAARGEVFEARDKVLTLLKSDNALAHC